MKLLRPLRELVLELRQECRIIDAARVSVSPPVVRFVPALREVEAYDFLPISIVMKLRHGRREREFSASGGAM